MTFLEALQWGTEQLKAANGSLFSSPQLDAEVLLGHALGLPKSKLFAQFAEPVSAQAQERYLRLIQRRRSHEPVAYITGEQEFYRRKFSVNPFVLIPRPATETLVEAALELARASDPDRTVFADVGTGSGAIAVTLAAESGLPVVATDISREALVIAKQNAQRYGVEEQADLRHGTLLEPVAAVLGIKPDLFAHLIVCANLPYLTPAQWETAQPEVRNWEPKTALVSGEDGLDAYWNLFRQIAAQRERLPKRITALIEIDPSQRETAPRLIRHDAPRAEISIRKDLEGWDRVVIAKL